MESWLTAAVLLDMDGVVTDTARAHAAVWKQLFDPYLARLGQPPFDAEAEYRKYVDGKPRYDGVASLLSARGVELPWGAPDDRPGAPTVCGLGNQKDGLFQTWLERHPVAVFPDTRDFIERAKGAGMRVAVFSASRNAERVLTSAGVLDEFDAKVDGSDLDRLHLPGKPDPAMLNEASSRLAVTPGRTAVVEDAIAGVMAGVRGGYRPVIGVERQGDGLSAAGAHLVVNTLHQVQVAAGTLAGPGE